MTLDIDKPALELQSMTTASGSVIITNAGKSIGDDGYIVLLKADTLRKLTDEEYYALFAAIEKVPELQGLLRNVRLAVGLEVSPQKGKQIDMAIAASLNYTEPLVIPAYPVPEIEAPVFVPPADRV